MAGRLVLSALFLLAAAPSLAATAVNRDGEARTIVVIDKGERTEVEIAPGESTDFCPRGCFVVMPNGDREALTGGETLEIKGGQGRVK